MAKRSEIRHTRLVFEPLSISCSIQCETPASPLVQTSNTLLNEYEPDRELTPCVIRPIVEVSDKDGIFDEGNINGKLATQSIKWYLNGIDIRDIPEFAGKYEIVNTSGVTRGTLILHRNIPVTEEWVITFEAQFEDWRRGKIETVQSNELLMYTSDLGEDIYSISIDKPLIEYNPVRDSLYIYEWQVNNGLIAAGNRDSYKDEKSYEQAISLLISSGTSGLTSLGTDMTISIMRDDMPIEPGTIDCPEIVSLNYPHLQLDLRMSKSAKYDIILKRNTTLLAKESFAIVRKVPQIYEAYPAFSSDVSPYQKDFTNMAIVSLKDQTLTYPEIFYNIRWFTQAMTYNAVTNEYEPGQEVTQNWGRTLSIPVASIGMGVTKNDNYFRHGFDLERKPQHSYATDGEDNIFTDEEDNELTIQ